MDQPTALKGKNFLPIFVMILGVMGISSGAIFARLADAHPLVICAYRVGIASCAIVPFALFFNWREYRRLERADVLRTLFAGLFLACHFAAWITSLSYTTVASSVVLVNTIPIWVTLINFLRGVQRPSRRMCSCVLLSFLGAAIVGYGDLSFSGEALWGDFLALAGAVFAAAYILFGKEVRKKLNLMPYVALCYASAAFLLWAVVLAMGLEISGFSQTTWGAFFGMALFSQILGHSSYNWALRYFSAGFVAILLLGEPIGSAVLAYFLFDEIPAPIKFIGFVLLLSSILLIAREEAK